MKPTFKAIEHKVDLALCLIAVLIALGFTFSNDATAKSMTDAEYEFSESNIAFNTAKVNCDLAADIASNKSKADAKSTRNVSNLEFSAQHKIVVVAKRKSKPSANTANLEIHRNIKSRNTNAMPVIDELNPAFKKSRLI